MDVVTAIRNRILGLCGERGININKLTTLSALLPLIAMKKSKSQGDYDQNDL